MAHEAALPPAIAHLREGVQVIGFDWTYLYVNEAAARHGLMGGGVAFLQEPFTPDTLIRKVRVISPAA